jgi:hypothetical protein
VNSRLWAAAALTLLGSLGCKQTVVIGDAPEGDAAMLDGATQDALPKVTWLSGAHTGNSVASYLDFGTWRGRPLDFAHVYPDRQKGWDGIVNPLWPVEMFSSYAGKLLISLPLYPEGQGNNQECARGTYDAQWRKLGSFLMARNRPDTILRLGWGFNDMEHDWRADSDPTDWIACFRRTVTAIRATDPRVLIDWSFNPLGPPNVIRGDPYDAYPGDAYVDFVGIEAFDQYPASNTQAEWNANCNVPTGLCPAIRFARQHGKKLGIAEWGVANCGGSPGGDNAFFVQRILSTFAANLDVMGYEAYFEDDGSEVCSSIADGQRNPNAAAKYLAIYSAR